MIGETSCPVIFNDLVSVFVSGVVVDKDSANVVENGKIFSTNRSPIGKVIAMDPGISNLLR